MLIRDPSLYHLAKAYIAEEATSALRHQLRNRIGVIRNANFFLRRAFDGSTDPRLREQQEIGEFFDLIDTQLGDMTRSISENIVPASDENVPATCDVSATIRALTDRLTTPDGFTITCELESAQAMAEAVDLQLAVLCLIENAVEAMAGGGEVAVRSTLLPDRRIAIAVENSGDHLSSDVLSSAFDPYFTTKQGHVGLGLNVARRVARRYGGNVELRNADAPSGVRAWLTIRAPRATAPGDHS